MFKLAFVCGDSYFLVNFSMMSIDEKFMRYALRLGRRGLGRTSPNPPVGAVIVIGDRIVGKGWHRRCGLPHAEIEAIKDAERKGITDFSGATMYVTLEPCTHYGRTPPCAEELVRRGFKRVVIGTTDPNPVVNGRGVSFLRRSGVEVIVGVLEREAKRLIEHFRTFITQKRAFLAVKWAQSIDGKIACEDGSSQWISSDAARKFAHKLRDTHDVVIVGAGTVMADNPRLTVRLVKGRNPVRLIVGGRRKLSASLEVFNDNAARTILVTPSNEPFCDGEPRGKVEIWRYDDSGGELPRLRWILRRLASEGLTSALLEGGAKLIGAAFEEKVADRIYAIVSPKIIGSSGINSVEVRLTATMDDVLGLDDVTVKKLGEDVLITGIPKYKVR